jgi:DNA-binding NarL/FixJ family response regulator
MMPNQSNPPEAHTRIDQRRTVERLTAREIEVLGLVADGCTTKEIAVRLKITFKTAACHRGRIMSKLGVHNGALLVRHAIREGYVQP